MKEFDEKEITRQFERLSKIEPSQQATEHAIARTKETLAKVPDNRKHQTTRVWKIPATKRFARIAAAAVIIVAVSIGVIQLLPNGEGEPIATVTIEIPTELAQMPIDELLEIHFGKTESPFDSSIVTAAVAQALNKLSGREVIDIGGKYRRKGEFPQAEREAYYAPAVSAVVEAVDFVVHAQVDYVTLDVNDLKHAILNPPPVGIDVPGRVKATVDLSVLDTYPSLPVEFEQKIRLWPVLTTDSLDLFEKGKEYMVSLRQYDGDMHLLSGWNIEGVYQIDPSNQTVGGSQFRYTSMTLEETWQFIMDCYDAIHKGIQPSDETLDFWLDKLQSENFTDCWSAVEYLSTLIDPPVPPELLLDAIQRQLNVSFTDDELEKSQPQAFIIEALDLFDMIADEQTVDKLLDLYLEEASSPESILRVKRVGFSHLSYRENRSPVTSVTRLTLKHLGPKRHERFMRLASCQPLPRLVDRSILVEELGRTEGEDVDRLLMQMVHYPATFGVDNGSESRGSLREIELRSRLWDIMARRKLPEFAGYLDQFLADPNGSDLTEFKDYEPERLKQAIELAEKLFNTYYANQDERENARKRRLQDLVDQYRNGLSVTRNSENWTVYKISEIIKPEDTEFLSVFAEGLNQSAGWRIPDIVTRLGVDPRFVPAIRKALEHNVSGELLGALYACGAQEEAVELALAKLQDSADCGIIEFLGTTNDSSVLPVIESFTHKDVIDTYHDGSSVWDSYDVPRLQNSAILALARLGAESAIPRLKELYESEDTDLKARISSALSLYYLGDDTGYELLEYFVNGTERRIPELKERDDIYHEAVFYPIAMHYLSSPYTDALLLEHSHRTGCSYFGTPFFRDNEREILPIVLPILADNLESRDRKVRSHALNVLKNVTGLDVDDRDLGFQPGRFVGQQTEAVERWRDYVEQYLAEIDGPVQ